MVLTSPPACIIVDKEGDLIEPPKIANMPQSTQKYLKQHNIGEYETVTYVLSNDRFTDSTLSLRAIDAKDIVNFMPDLESKSEAQLMLLIKRVLQRMKQEQIPMVMKDFRDKLMVEIQDSQLIHRQQRPALARAVLSNTLDIFDQSKRMPILPGTLLQPGKVSVIDCTGLDQNTRRVVVIYLQLMLDKFMMQAKHATCGALLIVDEAEEYFGQANSQNEKLFTNRIVSKMEDVVNRGRKHRLGLVLGTHSPSSLNRTVTNLANIKVAFGLSGDSKWISEFFGKNLISDIEKSPTGKAHIAAKITTANNDRLNVKIRIPYVGHKNDLPEEDDDAM
jgi:hypothetical protein